MKYEPFFVNANKVYRGKNRFYQLLPGSALEVSTPEAMWIKILCTVNICKSLN